MQQEQKPTTNKICNYFKEFFKTAFQESEW